MAQRRSEEIARMRERDKKLRNVRHRGIGKSHETEAYFSLDCTTQGYKVILVTDFAWASCYGFNSLVVSSHLQTFAIHLYSHCMYQAPRTHTLLETLFPSPWLVDCSSFLSTSSIVGSQLFRDPSLFPAVLPTYVHDSMRNEQHCAKLINFKVFTTLDSSTFSYIIEPIPQAIGICRFDLRFSNIFGIIIQTLKIAAIGLLVLPIDAALATTAIFESQYVFSLDQLANPYDTVETPPFVQHHLSFWNIIFDLVAGALVSQNGQCHDYREHVIRVKLSSPRDITMIVLISIGDMALKFKAMCGFIIANSEGPRRVAFKDQRCTGTCTQSTRNIR